MSTASWSKYPFQGVRLRLRNQIFLEQSGPGLLLCSAITAFGLYQGILTVTQTACFFVLGLFSAKCILQPLPLPGNKKLGGESALLIFLLVGVGRMNPPHLEQAPAWGTVVQVANQAFCHIGCMGLTTFLTFWLFHEVFAHHTDTRDASRT